MDANRLLPPPVLLAAAFKPCVDACAGLSLRTQELTASFLLVRLFCSFMMEYDIHTLLDFLTLLATGGLAASRHPPSSAAELHVPAEPQLQAVCAGCGFECALLAPAGVQAG